MTITNMVEFFVHELRESFNAQKQLVGALPRMIAVARSPYLRECLETRLRVTELRVDRLTEVFISIGEFPHGRKCDAIDACLRAGVDLLERDVSDEADDEVTDSALIAIAQKVTYHGIAIHSTLATWAQVLDFKAAGMLLETILQEERVAADRLATLSRLEFELPIHR